MSQSYAPAAPRTGPYEAWVFGPVGSLYAGAAPQGDPILACLGEVRAGVSEPAAMAAVLAQGHLAVPRLGRLADFRLPTLWRAAFASPGPSGAHILPGLALFEPAGPSGPQPPAHAAGAAPDGAATPQPDYGYRLNAPLRRASHDPAFADVDAALTPDPPTRSRIEARDPDAAGAPLVVVAVIDDGLAFAHPRLTAADGAPRVECCWLQGADAGAGAQAGRVLFGREWRRAEIADLAARHPRRGASLYEEAGSLALGSGRWSPLALGATHGAMTLDLAAGAARGAGSADDLRVIGVDLPPAEVIDTTGFGLAAYVLAAFHYVFRRADEIAAAYGLTRADVPLVVNLSFGVSGGPQDGKSRLEEALAHMIAARRALGGETMVTMPSGNHFLAGLHGELRGAEAQGGWAKARWRVQPCDRTPNYLEIWRPACAREDAAAGRPARLRVEPPGFPPVEFALPALAPTPQTSAPLWVENLVVGGKIVGQVSLDLFRGYRWRVMVILAPSQTRAAGLAVAPAGLWTVGVDVDGLGDGVIHCRIQRDNAMRHPWQGGLQSWFDDPRDRAFDATGKPAQDDTGAAFVRRFGSFNGLAAFDGALVVAGSDAATGRPAPYSCAGPLGLSPHLPGAVDTAMPSDDSPALAGRRAMGVGPAAASRWIGVSAAAPQFARRAAFAFLAGTPLAPVLPAPQNAERLGVPYAQSVVA
jgi:hypothetical protein